MNTSGVAAEIFPRLPFDDPALAGLPMGFLAVDYGGSVLAANDTAHHLVGWPATTAGPLPDALQAAIVGLAQSAGLDSESVGFSFSIPAAGWREAWITRVKEAATGRPGFWIFIRSVDAERRMCFESCQRLTRLSLVGEITTALNSTLGLEETFNVILVGVTAGQGLGFNRAFLFLADDDQEWLTGCIAIGPADPAQAEKIWKSLAGRGAGGLTEAVYTYGMAHDGNDAEVNRLVRAARIPSGGPDNPFADVIRGAPTRVICVEDSANPEVRAVFVSLDTNELACAPLRSRDKVLGLLLADHRITRDPITQESLHALELLAGQAGLAVERAGLADKLARQLAQLQQAREKIEGIQETVARMERFSIIGEITAEVAHQMRNPLTVIGGFARNLLSAKKPEDPEYHGLSVIHKHTERVYHILERIISVEGWESRPRTTFALEPVLRQSLEVMEFRFSDRQASWSLETKLDGFAVNGRPDSLRFALFKLFSGILQHLGSGAVLAVQAIRTPEGSRVVICPRSADKKNTGALSAITRIFQGEWGTGRVQRNLALEYLTEHHGALGMETTTDGDSAVVIDFVTAEEDAYEDSVNCRR